MQVKFNPTGTHIQKGFLKVRLDLYPDVGDKTYSIHYVDTVDEDGNPTGEKQLNPCLCHFVTVDKSISVVKLENLAKTIFDNTTVTKLDDALSESDTSAVSALMRTKKGSGIEVKGNSDQVKNAINSRLTNLEVEV